MRSLLSLLALIGLSFSMTAGASPGPWLRFFETAPSGTHRSRSFLRLDQNSRIRWETTSRGGDCAPSGGAFEGSMSPEGATRLAQRAFEALESQAPKSTELGPSLAEGSRFLDVDWKGRSLSRSVNQSGPAVESFFHEMAEVMGKLKPQGAVTLKARVKGPRQIAVQLHHEGAGTVVLPMSSLADDLFFLSPTPSGRALGSKRKTSDVSLPLRFLKAPKLGAVVLGKHRRVWEGVLEVRGMKDGSLVGRELRFLTQGVRHHAAFNRSMGQFSSGQEPSYRGELDLCVTL